MMEKKGNDNTLWWVLGGAGILTLIAYLNKEPIMDAISKLSRLDFINKFKGVVKNSTPSGLFPSVMMAQAILESSNGNSTLSKLHNNFFGIKADKNWTGQKVIMKTTEYVNGKPVTVDAAFRKYNLASESFADHAAFLKKNSRYTNAGVFSARTPEEQAAALLRAGYATDPAYASKLDSLIDKYSLKTLDA